MPLASSNNTNIAITTTADTSGINSTNDALEKVARQLEVVRQKQLEYSQSDTVKKSTVMALNNSEIDLNGQFDALIKKQDEGNQVQDESIASTDKASSGFYRLSASYLVGNAAYTILTQTLQKGLQFLTSSVDAANKYQSAVMGLASVSSAFGTNSDQATQAAKSLASDGLMSVTDAATGLKNLLATGFSLPQATDIMNRFKDSAAFGRQSTLGFGEAIDGATEGLKNGNSQLTDNAGMTKNLSVILQEQGKSQSDVMNITTDATVRQALYNGIMQETVAQQGDAAKAADTFAAKQSQAGVQLDYLKQAIGGVEEAIGGPLLQSFTSFLATNQKAIVDFGAASLVAAGFGLALYGIVAAIKAFSLASILAVASNPLLLALTALSVVAGIGAYNAIDKLQAKVKENNDAMTKADDTNKKVTTSTGQVSQAQQDLAQKLSDINDQIAKNNRDFMESLAETIKAAESKATDLKKQLDQEDSDYAKSQANKLAQFNKTQEDTTESHQKTVDKIQKQIDNETALGKWADQAKLADLRQQIADENAQYDEQMADKQATYNSDVADAKDSHTQKTNDLQTQLNQENTLLKKHAADVASIQNVTLLDEIDKIKRSHQEQLTAFDEQKTAAIKSSGDTIQGIIDTAKSKNADAKKAGQDLGQNMAIGFKDMTKDMVKDFGQGIANLLDFNIFDWLENQQKKSKVSVTIPTLKELLSPKHNAAGGPVSAGEASFVGDNPDGSLNSTTELFVPNQSGTIISASKTRQLLGGAGGSQGVTINQTNHIYNQVDMDAANTELGFRLAMARI